MTRLLLDEMLSPRVAEELRGAGADALGVSEAPALRGTSDAELLEFCAAQGRVLVTANIKDFVALHRREQGHAGILLVSSKAFPQDRGSIGRLVAALSARLREDRWPGVGTVDFL